MRRRRCRPRRACAASPPPRAPLSTTYEPLRRLRACRVGSDRHHDFPLRVVAVGPGQPSLDRREVDARGGHAVAGRAGLRRVLDAHRPRPARDPFDAQHRAPVGLAHLRIATWKPEHAGHPARRLPDSRTANGWLLRVPRAATDHRCPRSTAPAGRSPRNCPAITACSATRDVPPRPNTASSRPSACSRETSTPDRPALSCPAMRCGHRLPRQGPRRSCHGCSDVPGIEASDRPRHCQAAARGRVEPFPPSRAPPTTRRPEASAAIDVAPACGNASMATDRRRRTPASTWPLRSAARTRHRAGLPLPHRVRDQQPVAAAADRGSATSGRWDVVRTRPTAPKLVSGAPSAAVARPQC